MGNNLLISILIIAYNPGVYLKKTLESCLDQTYQNTEILLLDNASSEDIRSSIILWFDGILEKTVGTESQIILSRTENKKQKTIRLIRSEENLGPYRGLNLLLEEAQGDYIAIQDHDDIWHHEKLMKQVALITTHPEYVGCGTSTVMYYETDRKYFEYYLGQENYYTIHPSLLFRYDGKFRYDTTTEYMCDAWSLKNNLCHGGKKIYNLSESLTLHLIKSKSENYSYRWHKLTWINIKRAYSLHQPLYATLTIGWEIKRKLLYPILNALKFGRWINHLERIPFRLMGKQIKSTQGNEWWKEYV